MPRRVSDRRFRMTRLGVELLEDRSMLDAALGNLLAPGEIDYTVSISVIPNDTSFGSLYGLNNTGQSGGTADADIDAAEAWDRFTGSTAITVGVIDTGIDYRHRDLYLNIWINQQEIPTAIRNVLTDTDADGKITFYDLNNSVNIGAGKITDLNGNGYIDAGDLLNNNSGWENGADNDGNGYRDDLIGWDFVSNDNDPLDDNNHGTHVAGTIGAIGNNGTGVTGVNWKTQMAALKFLGASGSGSTSGAIAAVNYATAKGIQITNNSWGGGGFSSSLSTAIGNYRASGGIFVAAAGNSGSNNDLVANYPSNYNFDNVVAVASSDRNDRLSSFSSFGATTVDLAAPGSSILSTTRNNTYSTFSGTSMATPHVAGAIALVWANEPSLTYSQVIARITSSVDTRSALAGQVVTGGRLNVNAALGTSTPAPASGPRVLSATVNSTTSASSLTVTFNEAINAATFTPSDITITVPGGGTITPTSVTGSGTTFTVTFAAQTAPGAYSFSIGPNVSNLAGSLMDQDQDGTLGELDDDRFLGQFTVQSSATETFTNSTPLALPDRQTVTSTLVVGSNVTIADIDVRLNITHTFDGDLNITLQGPDGTRVRLVSRRGGSGDNFNNTVLNDEAGTRISAGRAPFSSSYRPEAALSGFDGKLASGTWSLIIQDAAFLDTGTLNSWSITITAGVAPERAFFEGESSSSGEAVSSDSSVAAKAEAVGGSVGNALTVLASWLASERLELGGDTDVTTVAAEEDGFDPALFGEVGRREEGASRMTFASEEEAPSGEEDTCGDLVDSVWVEL